jgi:phosphoribosylpyrophosphate synthetase
MVQTFTIAQNIFLNKTTKGFYRTDYNKTKHSIITESLLILKNDFGDRPQYKLDEAVQPIAAVLKADIASIKQKLGVSRLTVCAVPRSKAHIAASKLQFKAAIRKAVHDCAGCEDGLDFITRITNTATTHVPGYVTKYYNDGKTPYKGITTDTCKISAEVAGKDILLIDDIYTESVNIDEDAIQALLDNDAKSVTFYAIAKTIKQNRY